MDMWKEIEVVLAEHSLLKHPFYQAWNMGTLSLEDLRFYAGQYYKQESMFPRYLSAVHSRCPDLVVRQSILSNLAEEERGPDNHTELWLRFAEGVGASRDEIRSATSTSETEECVRSFESLTREGHWAEGLAALYAYEVQQPEIAKTKLEGLKAFYGIGSESALKFFEVHREMDVWHADAEKEILNQAVEKDPSLGPGVVEAVRSSCQALNTLLDGVCRVRGIAACAA